MEHQAPGPDLSPETLRCVDILFHAADRDAAKSLLFEQCGHNLRLRGDATPQGFDRLRTAALKISDGSLAKLESAARLAQKDWRDLLMAAGFGHDVQAHAKWEPKPADEPSEIDVPRLASIIHERLSALLAPLGFAREGEEWRRPGEVPQKLRLVTGLTSRIEVRFFLRVTFDAQPAGVVLHLPKLPPKFADQREQGYFFRAGDNQEELGAAVEQDVVRYALPLLRRFTSAAEVRRGFEDRSFQPHVKVEGNAWIF